MLVPTCPYIPPSAIDDMWAVQTTKRLIMGFFAPKYREGPHQAWFAMACFTITPLQKPPFRWQTTTPSYRMTKALKVKQQQ